MLENFPVKKKSDKKSEKIQTEEQRFMYKDHIVNKTVKKTRQINIDGISMWQTLKLLKIMFSKNIHEKIQG